MEYGWFTPSKSAIKVIQQIFCCWCCFGGGEGERKEEVGEEEEEREKERELAVGMVLVEK